MISEHKADERPSAAPAAGLTRRRLSPTSDQGGRCRRRSCRGPCGANASDGKRLQNGRQLRPLEQYLRREFVQPLQFVQHVRHLRRRQYLQPQYC